MQKSDSIANLAAALSQVQGKLNGAVKDSVNPFFKSKYANLEGVWESIRAPMAEHGLSVSQLPGMLATGQPTLTTMLMHKSGEWISTEQALFPLKQEPQGIAAAITYARRSALSAIVGQVESEDDGEEAHGRKPADKQPDDKKPASPPPNEQEFPASPPRKFKDPLVARKISEPQLVRLNTIASKCNVSEADVKGIVAAFGFTSRKDITTTTYNEIVSRIQAFGGNNAR